MIIHERAISRLTPGPRFNKKISSYQYGKSHCGDKTVVRSSYLHNGISYIGKITSLYWIRAQSTNINRIPFYVRNWTHKDIPLFFGELWLVYCKYTAENWSHLKDFCLYIPFNPSAFLESNYFLAYVTLVFFRYPFSIFGCNFPMSFHHHSASFAYVMWIQGKGPPACGWLVQVSWYLVWCRGRTPLMATPLSHFQEGVLLVRTLTSVTGLFIGIT